MVTPFTSAASAALAAGRIRVRPLGGLAGQGQAAAHRAQLARQRELAGELVLGEGVGGDLPGRGQDAQGDRQIEQAALFGQVGRGEVDGDPPLGKLELAGLQRGAHPVAGFAHLDVGQPDQRERGQAIGKVDFDADLGGGEANEGATGQDGQAHDEARIKPGVYPVAAVNGSAYAL
jgi:hypothetical protein